MKDVSCCALHCPFITIIMKGLLNFRTNNKDQGSDVSEKMAVSRQGFVADAGSRADGNCPYEKDNETS